MPDVTTKPTSLLDAINICLSSIGELKADAVNESSANVVMAKQIIEEVNRDVQSKGWWFNTANNGDISILSNGNPGTATENFNDTGGTDNNGLPEEARRYIAIRSARIFQSRVVGSEELFKFTFEEEKVSLAILTQAHVRNGGNSTSFTSFPAEIKSMGVEEVMFLQQSAEEKLLTLRLSTELKSGAKIDAETVKTAAETELVKDQEALINQQRLTEVEETSKRASEKALVDAQELKVDAERALVGAQELDVNADTLLKGKQGFLIDAQKSQTLTESLLRSQQTLTEVKETAKRDAETSLLGEQKTLVTNQALTEVKRALDIVTDSTLKTKQGLLIDNQAATELKNALKVVADTDLTGAVKLKTDAERALLGVQETDVAADTTLKGKQGLLIDAQKSQALTDTLLRSQQVLTEIQETAKRLQETELVKDQEELVTKQALTEVKRALDIVADTDLKSKQGTLIDNQAATELKNALKVVADTTLVSAQKLKVDADRALTNAQEANVAADTALKGKQGELTDAQTSQALTDTLLRSQQVLTEVQETTKREREAELIDTQETLVKQQELTEKQETTRKNKEAVVLEKQASKIDADKANVQEQTKLVTAQELKTDAETANVEEQTKLVTAQELKTDAERALLNVQETDVSASASLKGKQGELTDAQTSQTLTDTLLRSQQVLTETQNTSKVEEEAKLITAQELKVDAEKALLDAQKDQVTRQSDLQDKVELNFHLNSGFSMAIDGVAAGRTFRDFSAEMRMMGFQEVAFQALPAYKKVELVKDAKKLRDSTATEQGINNLNLVNRVMRLIGEPPVNDIGANSLASVTYRLLDEVDEDLQGRGWYFNTDHDVELSPLSNGTIELDDRILSVEVDDIPTYIKEVVVGDNLLIRRDGKTFTSTVKATTITQEIIASTPKKYREYLMVRVALIITELYPHSGIDVQRLTKMEAELKAYFKDRENDEANYTVFDNYDVASRMGINRNYQLI